MPVDDLTEELRASVLTEVEQDLDNVRQELEQIIIDAAPQGTGELRQSIHVDPWQQNGNVFVTSAHADVPQAQYTDEGTGIYSGGGRIYPTQSNALVFEWHGQTVAFASVAGIPAQRWFQEPMADYVDRAFGVF